MSVKKASKNGEGDQKRKRERIGNSQRTSKEVKRSHAESEATTVNNIRPSKWRSWSLFGSNDQRESAEMQYIQLLQHSSTLSTACASQHSSLGNPVSTNQSLVNAGERWSTLVNDSQRWSTLIGTGHTDQGIQQVNIFCL